MSSMTRRLLERPDDRFGFKIAVICALSLEADMVELLFDKRYDKDHYYEKAPNDSNTYTTGLIGKHHVVLTYCPEMGNDSAARTASRLMSSFINVQIIFVVGICGAVPTYSYQGTTENIFLGDCLISKAVIHLDFGREGPAGFKRKDGLDGLGKPADQIQTLMAKLQTSTNREALTNDLQVHLDRLRLKQPERINYPGTDQDRLYQPSYIHSHHVPPWNCEDCDVELGICAKDCESLGCQSQNSELRRRLEGAVSPRIHFGTFGSSNRVLKSGLRRDELAKMDNVIAFEMEGAGIWNICPTIVIKAACDYADSHKNKKWQAYSAAIAAAGMKAFLGELELFDSDALSEDTLRSINDGSTSPSVHDADLAIQGYYRSSNRLHVERLTGEKLPLDRCYINLSLVDRSDRRAEKEDDTRSPQKAPTDLDTTDTNQSISLNDLFKARKTSAGVITKPRRIYIQGRAGVGKTTLCKKVVHEFLDGLWSGLFDRILWLPLRNLKSRNDQYGWQELLRDAYSPRVEGWSTLAGTIAKQLLYEKFLSRTLFLFDGLDEVSHRWTQEDKMFQFVESITCDVPNIIVTSRPQANSFDIGKYDLELETIGFSPVQVDAYLENCVKDKTSISKMKALIRERPLIQGLLRIPIQLDAFCCTWPTRISSSQADKDTGTMTMLYQSITNELFRKDIQRLGKVAQAQRLADVKIGKYLQNELVLLEEYAFQGMCYQILSFTPQHRNKIDSFFSNAAGRTIDLDSFVLERLSFLRTSDIEEDPSKRNHHFLHLTFQEFFAAKHFVRHWRSGADLALLGLKPDYLGDKTSMSPKRFLQLKKYVPRYGIFWRFVTGLVQIQTEQASSPTSGLTIKNELIVTLFDQFKDKPIDLLGCSHRWLIMYCLSEVAPSGHRHIQELRAREESALRQWVISELKSTRSGLGSKAEFPEHILCDVLESHGLPGSQNRISAGHILSTLESRLSVGVDTLRFVSQFITPQLSKLAQPYAMGLIFKNSRPESREVVEQATQHFLELYRCGDSELRWRLRLAIGSQSSLPLPLVTIFTLALKDEVASVRAAAALALGRQSCLHPESIAPLIVAFKDANSFVRTNALATLVKGASLPTKETTALCVTALKDESPGVRSAALSILGARSSLLDEQMDAISAAFSDDDWQVRSSAAAAIAEQSFVPEKGLTALSAALKDENTRVRISAAAALGKHSSLPPEGHTILTAALKHHDHTVRRHAIDVLGEQSPLLTTSIIALTTALLDESSEVRESAAAALGKQSSLPAESTTALMIALQDKHASVRISAAEALRKRHSLSGKEVKALLGIFDHGTTEILDLLGSQGSFYSNIQYLDNRTWNILWRHWIHRAESRVIYCYEFEGCLYVSVKGLLHQICNDPLRTTQMLQVVLPTGAKPSQSDTAAKMQSSSLTGFNTTLARQNPRSRWYEWLKKKHL